MLWYPRTEAKIGKLSTVRAIFEKHLTARLTARTVSDAWVVCLLGMAFGTRALIAPAHDGASVTPLTEAVMTSWIHAS